MQSSHRIVIAVALFMTHLRAQSIGAGALDTASIEELTRAKGKLDVNEGVFKVSVPRKDLRVTIAGVRMTPPLGLTSWAAFEKAGNRAIVMGDMVVLEDQVAPVMDVVLASGLEVTALHNHFLWDTPRVMFMHVGGVGDEERLARAVGNVFRAIDETSGGKGSIPRARVDTSESDLDPKKLDRILGAKGELADGVYKATIGRTTRAHGAELGSAMGVNSWAAFAGTETQAVVDGDFAVLEPELQPVLKTLRAAGIVVVAIHNHMTHEKPRIVFLHYWGTGPVAELAKGVRAALERTKDKTE